MTLTGCEPYYIGDEDNDEITCSPVELAVATIRDFLAEYHHVRKFIEEDNFILMREFRMTQEYSDKLKSQVRNEEASGELFGEFIG